MSTDQQPIHPLRLCKEVRDFLDRVFDGAPDRLLVHLAKDGGLTDKQKRIVNQLIEEIEE